MKITQKLLLILMENAKNKYVGIPVAAKLPEARASMTEGERLGLAYLIGTLEMLGGLGIDTSEIELEYALNDSESIE